jgi:hypothetical protein
MWELTGRHAMYRQVYPGDGGSSAPATAWRRPPAPYREARGEGKSYLTWVSACLMRFACAYPWSGLAHYGIFFSFYFLYCGFSRFFLVLVRITGFAGFLFFFFLHYFVFLFFVLQTFRY